MIIVALPFGLSIFCSAPCAADEDTRRGVAHTQELLRDPKFRAQNAKDSKPAAELGQHIKNLSKDPATEQEIYNLAAEVMGNMKDLTPEQMAKIVDQAQTSPTEFAESFTPEQKRKLHEIVERMPASKSK